MNQEDQLRELAAPGLHSKVLELARQLPRGRALDLGAGEGAFSVTLKEIGFDTHACDVDSTLFRPADIPFRSGNINERIPFDDHFFDLVVFIEVLEHLKLPWRALEEIARVLRPGGILLLTTPNVTTLYQRFYYLFHGHFYGFGHPVIRNPLEHLHPFTIHELVMMMNENGIRIEAITFDRPFRLKKFLPTNRLTGLTTIIKAAKLGKQP